MHSTDTLTLLQHQISGLKVELAVSERLRIAMSSQLNQRGAAIDTYLPLLTITQLLR